MKDRPFSSSMVLVGATLVLALIIFHAQMPCTSGLPTLQHMPVVPASSSASAATTLQQQQQQQTNGVGAGGAAGGLLSVLASNAEMKAASVDAAGAAASSSLRKRVVGVVPRDVDDAAANDDERALFATPPNARLPARKGGATAAAAALVLVGGGDNKAIGNGDSVIMPIKTSPIEGDGFDLVDKKAGAESAKAATIAGLNHKQMRLKPSAGAPSQTAGASARSAALQNSSLQAFDSLLPRQDLPRLVANSLFSAAALPAALLPVAGGGSGTFRADPMFMGGGDGNGAADDAAEQSCANALAANAEHLAEFAAAADHPRVRLPKAEHMVMDWPTDCASIRARNRFIEKPASEEEANFPLAISRTVFRDYIFLESELAVGYAPQNWYCYALDARSDPVFKKRIRQLAECFPNVIVNEREFQMDSQGHNQIVSFFECAQNLASAGRDWRYLIALQNHDLQLKTNQELVRIFHWMDGANDIGVWNTGFDEGQLDADVDWSLEGLHLIRNETLRRSIKHRDFPQRLLLTKSYVQSALSRAFVDFFINQLDLSTLVRETSKGACFTDEYILASISASDTLQSPGGFTMSCLDRGYAQVSLTRYSLYTCHPERWWPRGEPCLRPNPLCANSRAHRHGVCVFSMEQLAHTKTLHSLFYNKAAPDFDYGAVQCWHREMYRRSFEDRGFHRLAPEVYKQLPQTRFQALKQRFVDAEASDAGATAPSHEQLADFDCGYRISPELRAGLFDGSVGERWWRTYPRRPFIDYLLGRSKSVECYRRHATAEADDFGH